MTTPDLRALALLLPLCFMVACDDGGDDPSGDGELRVGLWGEGASGETYSLHGFFYFDNVFWLSTADYADGTASLQVPFPEGVHTVELTEWQVMRGAPGEEQVQVDAELVTEANVEFWIADNQVTDVSYVFEIDGDQVPMQYGNVDLDVEFEEDDGICEVAPDAAPQLVYYNEGQSENLVGESGGWQAFVLTDDVRLADVTLMWGTATSHGLTVEVREGAGPDGPLLGEVSFGEFSPMWGPFFTGTPTSNIDLVAGNTYTLVAPDATGWQYYDGALPGFSSDMPNRYRGLAIGGYACD